MVRGLVLLATCSLCGLLWMDSASAASGDKVGLSSDGVTWSAVLNPPLFSPGFVWVPGDERIDSFFVRNQGPSGATLTISVKTAGDDLVANDDIRLRARVDGGAWQQLVNGAAARGLNPLPSNGQSRVDVQVTFDPAADNASQDKSMALTFVATLTEAVPTPSPRTKGRSDDSDRSDDRSDRDDDLPGTGSPLSLALVFVAVGLVGGGMAVTQRAKSHR